MYYVRIQISHSHNKLQPDTFLLNTGAARNVVNSMLVHGDRNLMVKSHPTPRLRIAIKEATTLLGAILLFVLIESLQVKFWFGIA